MGDAGDDNQQLNYNYNNTHINNFFQSNLNYEQPSTSSSSSGSSTALDSSNIGFQLLKKHGWQEGTGLGASQQGRLEPVKTYIKKNKRGLGSEAVKKKTLQSTVPAACGNKGKTEKMTKKAKVLSKRVRKMLDEEKQWQEKESERAFFREFWPENV